MEKTIPFWKYKTLEEMTVAEWESLCDGCGRCCMHKLEDEDTGDIYATSVACRLLDADTCQCSNYPDRKSIVPDCIFLDIKTVQTVRWLPKDCAYRLIDEGKDLEWWHPLVSGSKDTVHEAKISARGRVRAHEDDLETEEDYLQYIVGPMDEGR
ncbi:YcgN family cysteine cluster protein [Bartonella sp. LJL80]